MGVRAWRRRSAARGRCFGLNGTGVACTPELRRELALAQMVRKAQSLAQGSRDGNWTVWKARRKPSGNCRPAWCRKGFRSNPEGPTFESHLENGFRLLWEPGAGGWRPGGSETAGKAQG
jgi:hypothetical protein